MALALVVCLLLPALVILAAHAADVERISVKADKVVRPTERRVIGINIDYLMDGEKLHAGPGLEAALREMGVKCLRYPGGDKSDSFLWSVTPYDEPKPQFAYFSRDRWPKGRFGMLTEDGKTFKRPPLDFDQFMELCRALGAEPIICCCYDSIYWGTPEEGWAPTREQLLETAIEWVRYANVKKGYGVKYWEIGNESYLGGGGGPTAEQYARDFVEFSRAMREVDPSILVGPNGPNGPDAVGATDREEGRQVSWWKTLLEAGAEDVGFLAVHDYPCWMWHNYETYVRGRLSDEAARGAARHRATSEGAEATETVGGIRFGRAVDAAAETLRRFCSPEDAERIEIALTETNSADWSHLIGDNE
ncbi:MAG: alpha-L-arabinofuranosidase, partial [Planctomycetota bacterium]